MRRSMVSSHLSKLSPETRPGIAVRPRSLQERLPMDLPARPTDPEPLHAFELALAGKDPQTIAAYLGTLRDFVAWIATRPGGSPFQISLLTETALDEYLRHLEQQQRAPRTRSRALTALKR